jgi:hypothetical protein
MEVPIDDARRLSKKSISDLPELKIDFRYNAADAKTLD